MWIELKRKVFHFLNLKKFFFFWAGTYYLYKKFFSAEIKLSTEADRKLNTLKLFQELDFKTLNQEEIDEHFEIACSLIRLVKGVSQQNQLLLYGLYKQSLFGPCN